MICLLAAALDLIASSLCTAAWLRLVRLGLGLAALIAAPFADWSAITERQTNIDVAARTVTDRAVPGDLIVVTPWQFGIPFQHYYRGTAPWMTIPSIADHRIHRYDLMKAKMISAHPIDDLGQAVRATLLSGRCVWFVGGLNLPPPENGPMVLPPAPASRFIWDNRAYKCLCSFAREQGRGGALVAASIRSDQRAGGDFAGGGSGMALIELVGVQAGPILGTRKARATITSRMKEFRP